MHPQTIALTIFLVLTAACWAEPAATTQPADSDRPAPPTTQPATENQSVEPPADLNGKALPPPEPAAAPEDAPPPTQPAAAGADQPLTVQQQLAIFDQLQQRILKLQYQLQQMQEQNEKLTAALLESRKTAGDLQGELNRAAILRQIQKREVAELRDQLAAMHEAPQDPADSPTAQPTTQPTTQPTDETQRVDALVEVGRLKRENEKLQLLLELAGIEDSDEKNRKLLTQLQETTKTLQKVEALRRQLSSLVVKQADEVRALRDRQELMEKQIAELQAAPPASVPPPTATVPSTVVPPLSASTASTDNEPRIAVVAPDPLEPPTELPPADKPTADEPAPPPTQPAPAPKPEPQRIRGKITELGDVAIVINIGGNQGVEKGMRLIVFREDKFIGYLDITHVKDGEAAGTMSQRIREPKVGDNVIDRLE